MPWAKVVSTNQERPLQMSLQARSSGGSFASKLCLPVAGRAKIGIDGSRGPPAIGDGGSPDPAGGGSSRHGPGGRISKGVGRKPALGSGPRQEGGSKIRLPCYPKLECL
jgi:hypothetical protein